MLYFLDSVHFVHLSLRLATMFLDRTVVATIIDEFFFSAISR